VIGPLLGYLLVYLLVTNRDAPNSSEFTKIFLLASVPAFAAVVVAIFFMRETLPRPKAPSNSTGEAPKLSLRGFDGNFKRFLLVLALLRSQILPTVS